NRHAHQRKDRDGQDDFTHFSFSPKCVQQHAGPQVLPVAWPDSRNRTKERRRCRLAVGAKPGRLAKTTYQGGCACLRPPGGEALKRFLAAAGGAGKAQPWLGPLRPAARRLAKLLTRGQHNLGQLPHLWQLATAAFAAVGATVAFATVGRFRGGSLAC